MKARAQRTAGVQILPEADELHVEPGEFVEHFEEVLHRSGQPVRCPHQDHVEPAAARIGHQPIQARPASFGSRHPIRILLDDLPAALIGHLPQVIELRLGMLIERRDP